jgi:hypothetical protein
LRCWWFFDKKKTQTYLEKEHQSNDINRVEEPKKDKIKVNEEMKEENI